MSCRRRAARASTASSPTNPHRGSSTPLYSAHPFNTGDDDYIGFDTSTLEANAAGSVVFEGTKGNYEDGYRRNGTVFARNYTNGVGIVNSTTVRLHAGQPWTAFSASLDAPEVGTGHLGERCAATRVAERRRRLRRSLALRQRKCGDRVHAQRFPGHRHLGTRHHGSHQHERLRRCRRGSLRAQCAFRARRRSTCGARSPSSRHPKATATRCSSRTAASRSAA